MILPILRLFVLILLIFSIMVDINIPVILHTQVNQLIIAIIIIAIILLIDEILGFLLGILFLVLYFKYYQKLIKNNTNNNYLKEPLIDKYTNNKDSNENADIIPPPNQKTNVLPDHYVKFENNETTEMPFISNQLLMNAQTNIYDTNNYTNEIRLNENTYGIQGLNSDSIHYPAFDNDYKNYHLYE